MHRSFILAGLVVCAALAPAASAAGSDDPPQRELCIVTYAPNPSHNPVSSPTPRDFCINY